MYSTTKPLMPYVGRALILSLARHPGVTIGNCKSRRGLLIEVAIQLRHDSVLGVAFGTQCCSVANAGSTNNDTEGIRTLAGRARWISGPTP